LNARSPELFFGESGYPLPFRTTGCPAAAAAAAPIARRALKVLVVKAGITKISFFKILHAQFNLERLAHLSACVTKKLSKTKKILSRKLEILKARKKHPLFRDFALSCFRDWFFGIKYNSFFQILSILSCSSDHSNIFTL